MTQREIILYPILNQLKSLSQKIDDSNDGTDGTQYKEGNSLLKCDTDLFIKHAISDSTGLTAVIEI